MRLLEFRCAKCGKLLGRIDGSAEIKCPRCRDLNIFKKPREIREVKNYRASQNADKPKK